MGCRTKKEEHGERCAAAEREEKRIWRKSDLPWGLHTKVALEHLGNRPTTTLDRVRKSCERAHTYTRKNRGDQRRKERRGEDTHARSLHAHTHTNTPHTHNKHTQTHTEEEESRERREEKDLVAEGRSGP